MKYIVLLSKENPELALGELKAVFHEKILEQRGNFLIMDGKLEYRRLAYAKEVCKFEQEFKTIKEFREAKFKGSFAVRQLDLGLGKRIEKDIADRISNKNDVDLENPDNIFVCYTFRDKIVLGKRIWRIDLRELEKRKNENRPFKSPVSTSPKIARTLINLSGIEKNQKLLDPFCGTGGFLIEGALINAIVFGSDIDEKMIEGSRTNLKFFGLNGKLRICNINNLDSCFEEEFDAIVTGLPYGRSAKRVGEIERAFLEKSSKVCAGRIVFTSNKKEIFGLRPKFQIYSHKSLTNYIYVTGSKEINKVLKKFKRNERWKVERTET